MKEFMVKEYINDEIFVECIKDVIESNTKEKLFDSLNKLDAFVSEKSKVDRIKIIFDNIKDSGEFRWEPFAIYVNSKYLDLSDNLKILFIYFHEKRHQLQFLCYQNKDLLLGKDVLEEIYHYLKRDDVSAISKRSIFEGIYGYYGRLIEKDAYSYECECVMSLSDLKFISDNKQYLKRIRDYYYSRVNSFQDAELAYWIEHHKKRFEARKKVESILLEKIKEIINLGRFNDREFKKILFSEKVFDALDTPEKAKVFEVVLNAEKKNFIKGDYYLEKMISKMIKQEMKPKKSR